MDIGTSGWIKKVRPKMPKFLGSILDVGSLNINGSAKDYLDESEYEEYLGIDMQEGKDVDHVMNAHHLMTTFPKEIFDTVICLNTLEHDDKFWITLENINYVLKPGGYLMFCEPTYNFPIHNHPKDYWRILEAGVKEVIFEGYELIDYEEVYSKIIDGKGVNPILCGLGKKL